MLAVPSNDTPPIVRAVSSDVAVSAFPISAALIDPAEKFPLASRWTSVLALLRFVAPFSRLSCSDVSPDPDVVVDRNLLILLYE